MIIMKWLKNKEIKYWKKQEEKKGTQRKKPISSLWCPIKRKKFADIIRKVLGG